MRSNVSRTREKGGGKQGKKKERDSKLNKFQTHQNFENGEDVRKHSLGGGDEGRGRNTGCQDCLQKKGKGERGRKKQAIKNSKSMGGGQRASRKKYSKRGGRIWIKKGKGR